jgi:hypothetical protein
MSQHSRSPKRRLESRFNIALEDLVLKVEALSDKVELLEGSNSQLKKDMLKISQLQEWTKWLYDLYQWLHKVFRNSPAWVPPPKAEMEP